MQTGKWAFIALLGESTRKLFARPPTTSSEVALRIMEAITLARSLNLKDGIRNALSEGTT